MTGVLIAWKRLFCDTIGTFPQLNTRINIVERITKYYTVGIFLQLNTRINIVERVTKYYTVGTFLQLNTRINIVERITVEMFRQCSIL
jgi:hypothetical protein